MNELKIKEKITEKMGETINEVAKHKIAREVNSQMERWNIDERWIDYMHIEKEEDEIYVNVGPRDLDFDEMGNQVGSGYLAIPIEEFPWVKQ